MSTAIRSAPPRAGAVEIRQYADGPDCDVVVTVRGREMVLSCPNYAQAVKWADLERKSYGIAPEPKN